MRIDVTNLRALLFGLAKDISDELVRPLETVCGNVTQCENISESELPLHSDPEVIFCNADTQLVRRLRTMKPDATIVVVSRHPEVSGWLDSIEAGATDYCAAPFEFSQLKWILESTLHTARYAA